ncbi:MAG: hypothetical protein WA907_12885, partial [Erythrobacter sp.]
EGFALAWDAALLAARAHAEATLADRAIKGVEEAVYYHGEEVARRTRYSDRLLLAHLARLDRLEEKESVAAMLPRLDECIHALEEGAAIEEMVACETAADDLPQDRVPPVPSRRTSPASPCEECGGACDDPEAQLGPGDCQWLGNRLDRMDAARPADAPPLGDLTDGDHDQAEVEALQLAAFEAGEEAWWLVPQVGPNAAVQERRPGADRERASAAGQAPDRDRVAARNGPARRSGS